MKQDTTNRPEITEKPSEKRELAELISKVLTHPLIPARLYDAMVDEIGSVGGPSLNAFYDGPDFIELILEETAAAEEEVAA